MDWLLRLLPAPSSERLAGRIVKALSQAGATDIRRQPGSMDIQFQSAGGDTVGINLENLYRACRFSWPWHRPALRERFLRPYFEDFDLPASWAEAAPDVFPALRDSFTFEAARLQRSIDGRDLTDLPAGRLLTDRLSINLVFDLSDHMVPLSDATLAKWGVTFDQALQRALANFGEETEAKWSRPHPGVLVSAWGDDYDATRLLLGPILRDVEVDGQVVAFVPSRDTLILTGSNDLAGLIHGFKLAMSGMKRANAMTLLPLRRTGMGWEPLVLKPDHLCYEIYQRLRTVEYGELYAAQKQLLDELAEVRKDETYVSDYTEHAPEGCEFPISLCAWARGGSALLPETDHVIFLDPEKEKDEGFLGLAPWEKVVEVCGPLLRRTGDVPARYRVEQFPSEGELRALGIGT
jgi:hypothetical protein